FRIERAPAHVLAPLLAESKDSAQLDEVLGLLVPQAQAVPPPARVDLPNHAEAQALLSLRGSELLRLRDELERAREVAARARERESELLRRVEQGELDHTVMRRELGQRSHQSDRSERSGVERDQHRRFRELEAEREGFLASDEALRRQLARNQTRLRELEALVAELEALLPKGKRRRKPPPPEPVDAVERRFRLPRFLLSFYKSLEGKERRAIERAFQAILLFCTEGHSYPGLEVKQMGGQDTWSFRASLGLRVYFRQLPDGDVELLELGDREEQNTTLRRLKDR
ncbi:MAG: hypothetical protein ABIP94_19140, partial [Planctomycetota bacterium]